MEAKPLVADLHLAFDVGHSSLGWAVLKTPAPWPASPEILGTGVVIFGADDCLASKRRQLRRARRHTRSTRQRIKRMEHLLQHLGALKKSEIAARHRQGGGESFAWRKAAELLSCTRQAKPLRSIGWPEVWEILRWYAHNRGYDGNARWARSTEEQAEDTEKEENARGMMAEFKTGTMAETITAYTERYDREAADWHMKRRSDKPRHFKGLGAAFPREVVFNEVRTILTALEGRLPGLDRQFIRMLLGNGPADRGAWQAIAVPGLVLPKRYEGGLLFGQLVPRFDNRIIGLCPIWYARRETELRLAGFSEAEARRKAEIEAKLPMKKSPDFLRFRWAMQLANLFGARPGQPDTHPLTAQQRNELTKLAQAQGGFTAAEFKKAVRATTGWKRDNLDETLLHPDADKALILDPVQRTISKSRLGSLWPHLPTQVQKRLYGQLRRGRELTPAIVASWIGPMAAFDSWLEHEVSGANTRKAKGKDPASRESVLAEPIKIDSRDVPTGRAPHARPILRQAVKEVLNPADPESPRHPREKGGCLELTEPLREAQLRRRLVEQTNNHLVRHRLLMLERLLDTLIEAPEFGAGGKERIASLTIEVNRDLRDLSGKTAKEIAQDLGLRLGDFKRVAAKVEEACQRRGIPITASLIRKARIAEDLGWTCPYTAVQYCIDDLIEGRVDKDHIIPHADRQSDSLDSLVITFSEVNRMKGRRTAMQFISDEGGKAVAGNRGVTSSVATPTLSIQSLEPYKRLVETLDIRKGHDDDKARKKRRKQRLLLTTYEEKEFTHRDLTVTSHLVRLGAQVLERRFLDHAKAERPRIVSLPGSVTGEVRKAWDLLGCLSTAAPQTVGKTKTEVRAITHLHHALDACVLGLAAWFFPANGSLWQAMIQRRPSALEAAMLRSTGMYQADSEGRMRLAQLDDRIKEQMRQRLAERRVVQHIPADMSGVRIEENTRRVLRTQEDRVVLRQVAPRDGRTGIRPSAKETDERLEKVLGLEPPSGAGKLTLQKGVRVITDNFGVAILDHASAPEDRFIVVPWHRVWHRLQALRAKNAGKAPRVIRNGMLLRLTGLTGRMASKMGVWRVFSVKQSRKLDLGSPDRVAMADKGDGVWREVSLDTLGPDRIELLPRNLSLDPTDKAS